MNQPTNFIQNWLNANILAKIPAKIDRDAVITAAVIGTGLTLTVTGLVYLKSQKNLREKEEEYKNKIEMVSDFSFVSCIHINFLIAVQDERTIFDLKQRLLGSETNDLSPSSKQGSKKEIRIFLDGVFDMMHYGHMNAFRQARSLGTYLIAGVCDEEDTARSKGHPVCHEQERIDTVRGCKWVDEVIANVPYNIPDGFYASLIEKHKIDYIVHGDDPCIIDGKNLYESAIQLGKYLTIPRTEGISTTELVGRMLDCDPDEHDGNSASGASNGNHKEQQHEQSAFRDRESSYLTTARMIRLFGAGVKVSFSFSFLFLLLVYS
jgi:cytidyltransferase-like protein